MYDFHEYKKSDGAHKFLTLSFDDSVSQDVRFIGLLNKYGIKCTFNLNSGLFGTKHTLATPDFTVDHSEIPEEKIADTYRGHEVAGHSLHHPRLDLLSRQELLCEVDDDRKNIERLTGQSVIGMAYPGGPFYNDSVIETITKETPIFYARNIQSSYGFDMPGKLMDWAPTCHFRDERAFDLADSFICAEAKEDMLFYLWGHTYEFDIYSDWERAEELLRHLSGKADICYATNGEIATYIKNNYK